MSDASDRLPPEIEAFFAPERRRSDPPAAVQDALFTRIGATLGFPGGPGPGSDPTGGAVPGGPAGGGAAVAAGAKPLVAASLGKTIATLVVGGVIGGGFHEAYDRVSERRAAQAPVVAAAPAVATPLPPPPPVEPPTPPPEPTLPPAPTVRAETAPAKPERPSRVEVRERDRGLAAERTLIEQARTALAREQGAMAMAVLERHARDFPWGELEEERESLLVQALVGLEREEQARKQAARFHRRFPRSIFGAVVDEALRSIP